LQIPGVFGEDISSGSKRFSHNNLSILKFFLEINLKSRTMVGSLNIRVAKVPIPLEDACSRKEKTPGKGCVFRGYHRGLKGEWNGNIP